MQFSTLLMLSLTMTSLAASAAPERFQQKLSRMSTELGLSGNQKSQLQKIHEDYHKNLPEKKKAMIEARDLLQDALRGSMSETDCQKRFDDLEKRQAEFGRARFQKILAVRSVLTPEQRQKFKSDDDDGGRASR